MDYISDYQYITVITEIYLYPIIMIYPEKRKKVTLLVFLIFWILSDNGEKQKLETCIFMVSSLFIYYFICTLRTIIFELISNQQSLILLAPRILALFL